MAIPVGDMLRAAGLGLDGTCNWGMPVVEQRPGVYLVETIGLSDDMALAFLSTDQRERWVFGETLIYVGKTQRALGRRIDEFYRHKRARRSPHAGGQHILQIPPKYLRISWTCSGLAAAVERQMLHRFFDSTGRLPFGNRRLPR